jgi:hypothetical protein
LTLAVWLGAGGQLNAQPTPNEADDGALQEAVVDDADAAELGGVQLPDWLDLAAEYRMRFVHADPYELSGTRVRHMTYAQGRGRIDLALRRPGLGGIVLQADLLDGVLFGDNGSFTGDPSAISGVSLTVRRPNVTAWEIGLLPGADPLDADSYVPILRDATPIEINHLYGEVMLPIGLLRVGRQPMVPGGANLSAHDGARRNRWGASEFADSSDRVLFATKLDAAIELIRSGGEAEIDRSLERGLFIAFAYDWLSQGEIVYVHGDDTIQMIGSLMWLVDEAEWLGARWRDLSFAFNAVHLNSDDFETDIWSFPTRFQVDVGPVGLNVQYSVITGDTREISEGFAVLSSRRPTRQRIIAHGAQAVVDYHLGPLTLTLEGDFASGDEDPRPNTDLTVFQFARDLNVGLLLFEHIIAFESARSAAVGIENLANLDSPSFPLTEVSSEGRFTNAIALFPQVKVDLLDTLEHHLHTRVGALFAWPEAGVVDAVTTILAEDGNQIADDAVNYHGGDPGDYYGTELDAQIEWRFRDMLIWTLEGAVLFPGSSLEDENGDALTTFLVENRFVFLF